jgi:hypothetical protein
MDVLLRLGATKEKSAKNQQCVKNTNPRYPFQREPHFTWSAGYLMEFRNTASGNPGRLSMGSREIGLQIVRAGMPRGASPLSCYLL